MNLKKQNGSISLFVLIALLFYMSFLVLLYASNVNKIQTISEKIEAIKSIYSKNYDNVDEVYNWRLAQNDTMEPVIKDLPTKILTNNISSISTNVTTLDDSYEEYGALGGKAKYVVFENEFSSLKEVVEYAKNNSLYGECTIQITAYGNNEKVTTSTQTIQILKGAEITSQTDLENALSTQESLYIRAEGNVEFSSTINITNATHTLDLNSYTLSYSKVNESFTFLTIGSDAGLTVIDGSDEKAGCISVSLTEEKESDGTARENTITAIKNEGTLVINSGKVSATVSQKMLKKKDSTKVKDVCVAIENTGTMTINDGTIYSNIATQGCVYMAVRRSQANGRGIVNSGTLNLKGGTITTIATADIVRASGATVWGKTYAYAYGILGEGTINTTEKTVFSTTATANSSGTYKQDSEQLDISESEKVVVEEDNENS